jgi:hypothetical protein
VWDGGEGQTGGWGRRVMGEDRAGVVWAVLLVCYLRVL